MRVNKYIFHTVYIITSLIVASLSEAQGLHIVNQTGTPVRIRMSTIEREYANDLAPNQAYFQSYHPTNLTVYSPQGFCSQFYNIGMNSSVFTHLLIRRQKGTAGCYVIGFTGRSRQRSPRPIPAVAFDPNYCRRNCWNPTTGTLTVERTTGVKTGLYTEPTPILGSGTDLTDPNPSAT